MWGSVCIRATSYEYNVTYQQCTIDTVVLLYCTTTLYHTMTRDTHNKGSLQQ